MDHSNKHQGELSLLEMIQNLKSPDGRKTPEPTLGSASMTIALNEEKQRRQVNIYGNFLFKSLKISFLN